MASKEQGLLLVTGYWTLALRHTGHCFSSLCQTTDYTNYE